MIQLPNIRGLMTIGKAALAAHRPEILFGASVASTLGAVVAAAKGGYDARGKVNDAEMERVTSALSPTTAQVLKDAIDKEENHLTVKEKIQLTWMNYLPAAGLTAGALGSTTGLHIVHLKEKKAIATAALMAIDEIKNEANDYKEKVLEIVNDDRKTHAEKSDEIEHLEPEKGWDTSDVVLPEPTYWCWDDLANRPVKSTRDLIRRAGEVLLSEINKTGKADLNLFYEEIDLSPSQMGAQLGWTKEDVQGYGGKKGMEFISFGLTDMPDGSSAVAFWFREPPTTDYQERAKS